MPTPVGNERFDNREKMYKEGAWKEKCLVVQTGEMPLVDRSFRDSGFIDVQDGLRPGTRIALEIVMNPEKKTKNWVVDHWLTFHALKSDNKTWKKIITVPADSKGRNAPKLFIDSEFEKQKWHKPNLFVCGRWDHIGLDEGLEGDKEYGVYLKALAAGIDVWLLYVCDYKDPVPYKGESHEPPPEKVNQNLWLTSTRRVKEADDAGMLMRTKGGDRAIILQLPFELILPSGKPLFQKVIPNFVIKGEYVHDHQIAER